MSDAVTFDDWFDTERAYATACIALGGCVAAMLAPTDSLGGFVSNAAFFWMPQLMVLGILVPFSPRPAAVSGVAVVLALYLAVFGYWVFNRPHPESLAWLGYLASLPGSVFGAIIGALVARRRLKLGARRTFALSALFAALGLLGNQLVVCSTVMYCGA